MNTITEWHLEMICRSTVLDIYVIDIVLKSLYFILQIATYIACIIQRDVHDKRIFSKRLAAAYIIIKKVLKPLSISNTSKTYKRIFLFQLGTTR